MEIILALVVAAAVIFFGALISMGNERQRRAIDNLREQAVLWAMQDLRIKRERLAREVKVDDPLGWLNKIAGKICGLELDLQIAESFDAPSALLCVAGIDGIKIVLSPLAPHEIGGIKHKRHNRLAKFAENHPLLSLPRNIPAYEISVLNAGILFDLELPLAWNVLTGQNMDHMDRLWMYMI
ncbi:MAG: hypothetical protein C4586_01185 [Anaerolineaceae bacterium]|nr:MAG: hypothetical protein C4586_01185 [Anaerolineaceae bacterium]